MMNPSDKDGKLLFEQGHPFYRPYNGHKVDGILSFDEIAAGGTPSLYKGGVPTEDCLAAYAEKEKQARAYIEARKSDPDCEPEMTGDPSREWIRQLAKSDPDQCRAILGSVNVLPEIERKAALRQAYTKFFYYESQDSKAL